MYIYEASRAAQRSGSCVECRGEARGARGLCGGAPKSHVNRAQYFLTKYVVTNVSWSSVAAQCECCVEGPAGEGLAGVDIRSNLRASTFTTDTEGT